MVARLIKMTALMLGAILRHVCSSSVSRTLHARHCAESAQQLLAVLCNGATPAVIVRSTVNFNTQSRKYSQFFLYN